MRAHVHENFQAIRVYLSYLRWLAIQLKVCSSFLVAPSHPLSLLAFWCLVVVSI